MQLMLPFSSKDLPDGRKLYRKVHGYTFTLGASGDTTYEITVPYTNAKINEASLLWFPEGVTANMKVLDTATGTYTTIPRYTLNQYGFNVAISKDFFSDHSPYDADVRQNMILQFTFTNSSTTEKTVGLNMVFHEVV